MALIPVTVASVEDEGSEPEEVATPAGDAIHIELPGRAVISVESGANLSGAFGPGESAQLIQLPGLGRRSGLQRM